jgi:hypothetical protein
MAESREYYKHPPRVRTCRLTSRDEVFGEGSMPIRNCRPSSPPLPVFAEDSLTSATIRTVLAEVALVRAE